MQFALKEAAQRLLDEAELASPFNPCPNWGYLTISAPKSIARDGQLGCVISANLKYVQRLMQQITSLAALQCQYSFAGVSHILECALASLANA